VAISTSIAIGRLHFLRADADRLYLGSVEIDDLTAKRLRVIETAETDGQPSKPKRFSYFKHGKEGAPLILEPAPRGTYLLHECGLRDRWTARLEGQRGIVLQHQLDLGGLTLARDLADECKSEIDASSDAGACDSVPVLDRALVDGDCAHQRDKVETQPMRRVTVAFEKTGGAGKNRTRADRGDIAAALPFLPERRGR
jgi:hypothetical protein